MENLKVRDKVFYISRGLIYRGKIISIQEDECTIERIPNKNSIYLMKKRDRIHTRKRENIYATVNEAKSFTPDSYKVIKEDKTTKIYNYKGMKITFEEDLQTYLWAAKDGEDFKGTPVSVEVSLCDTVVATYYRVFNESKLSSTHYNNFIRKFLTSKEYRLQFLSLGKDIDDIDDIKSVR